MTNTQHYITRLEATLGTAEFSAVYQEVCGLNRESIIEIASSFVAKTAKSATRRDTLERIITRHINVVDSQKKREYLSSRKGA